MTLLLVRNNEPLKTVTVENSSADKDGLIAKIVRAVIAQKAAEDPFTKADSDTSKSVLEAVGSEDVFFAREG